MKYSSNYKALKFTAFAFIALCSVIIFICIYKSITYTSPPGAESMDYAFEIGVYLVFILFSIFGIISGATLLFSIRTKRMVAIISSIITNILHLLSFFTLIYINKDFCLIFPLIWLISLLISWVALGVSCKKS